MNDDLISKDDLIEHIRESIRALDKEFPEDKYGVFKDIMTTAYLNTIDIIERERIIEKRKKGHWIITCSVCGTESENKDPFCSYCGAKMENEAMI